ncbi:MAG: acylphosphatase, partial [Candidatus Methanoperedens sp.]
MQFKVIISGTVQGVGFRPFIYRTAKKNNVRGYIKNAGNSVLLLVEGTEAEITNFLDDVKNKNPPLSRITNIDIKPCKDKKYSDFQVLKSEKQGG